MSAASGAAGVNGHQQGAANPARRPLRPDVFDAPRPSSSASGQNQPQPKRSVLQRTTTSMHELATQSGHTLAILKEAVLTPFHSESDREGRRGRVFGGLAPHLLQPRSQQTRSIGSYSSAGSSSSTSSSALQRYIPANINFLPPPPTATSLYILESVPRLLAQPPTGVTPETRSHVPLLRGFKATIPSSELAKQRRRRVRGGLADVDLDVDGGRMGLKRLGDRARGLLTEGDEEDAVNGGSGSRSRRRRRRKGQRSEPLIYSSSSSGGGGGLSIEELARQADEIRVDKDNIRVRQELVVDEVDEVVRQLERLEVVRVRLEESLLRLQEEDLELDDELEGVKELMGQVPAVASGSGGGGTISGSSRRRRGPAFLPSEHDELPAGVAFMSLSAHQAPLTALDFTEPYGMLVTAGADDVVRVWDMCDGDEIGQLRGHEGTVKCVQIEDTLCLTGGADGAVRMWDLRMAEEYEESLKRDEENRRRTADGLDAHEHHHDLERKVSISAGSARATAGEDDASTSTSPCIRALEGHSKAVTALYYESGTLVTGSSDKTIRQWDAETGQCVLTMDILWAISNPPAASMIASSSAAEPRPPTISPPLSPVRPGLLGRASSSFRSPTGARRSHSIDPFDSPYPDMSAFGGGGGAVASPGASLYGLPGAGLLSSATTGTFAVPTPPYSDGSWEMYQDFVGGVQFWGYALASGSGDGGVRMWDMRTGQAHRTLIGHTGPVTCLQFDETHIVSGSLDKTLRIWDLRMGGAAVETLRYEYPVTALQFDSRKIVACTGENGIEVYNRTSLVHSRLTVNGHIKPAERLRFVDRYLVTGGRDGMAKVWAM